MLRTNDRMTDEKDVKYYKHALMVVRTQSVLIERAEGDLDFWPRIKRLLTNRNYLADEAVEPTHPLTSSWALFFRDAPPEKGGTTN